MKALVLDPNRKLEIGDISIKEELGFDDVRIAIHSVGICGSDVHYFEFGKIGPYVVKEPMVLGHEASGIILETGAGISHLKPGDRVCMEPGIPDKGSKASSLGMYNVDPKVRFWATPPIHGCLRESVVHPGAFTFRLPDNVTLEEGAMVEPLAVGLHAATKGRIQPGDIALVIGAGTIGMMTALCALAGGCSKVYLSDTNEKKLHIAAALNKNFVPIHGSGQKVVRAIEGATDAWGADVVFECSGNPVVYEDIFSCLRPGGRLVIVGIPVQPIAYDVAAAQAKEATVEHTFRYAHVFPRALALLSSQSIDVKPLITDTYAFENAIEAFRYALKPNPRSVKILIKLYKDDPVFKSPR